MTEPQKSKRSGRAARKAARAIPLTGTNSPVQAGMSGGTYKPLTDSEIIRIHNAALDALENIGLADAPQSGIDLMTGAGATLDDNGRLHFSQGLIEDTLAKACKSITLYGRDPTHDLQLSDKRVHFGTAGAAVHLVDAQTNTYRDCTLADLHDAARIADTLDNIHFVQRPMVARDVVSNQEMDLNTIYACCAATGKHVGTSITEPGFEPQVFELLHMIAGSEENWRARPFVSASNCFVVPPMKFATESCKIMEETVRGGMTVLLLSAGQAGATAPAPLATAIVQAVAECLAGLVYVNAIKPGHPAIFGTWPFVSDLRTGAMSGGSGEQALLTAACAQMHQFYGIPGGAPAGMADSKLPDMQSGWEQAMSNVMAGLSGLNMIYEAAGMHASLLGFCHESLILGDDMIGQALRCVRGIDVDDESISLDTMRAVCLGPTGHYLGEPQTLNLMQSEYIYPKIADRLSPKEWEDRDRPELLNAASARKDEILATRSTARFGAELDARIRDRFNIHLPA